MVQDDLTRLDRAIGQARKALAAAGPVEAMRLSAELNGILSLFSGRPPAASSFHQLLCTDTFVGRVTAEIVRDWLQAQGAVADVRCQKDLQTADMASFQWALSDLTAWCSETVAGYLQSHHVVFNLTGGFKSVQGFLLTLSSFYAHEAVYIFEAGGLLRIPRLPVRMDAEPMVLEHLVFFRRAAGNLAARPEHGLAETMYLEMDGGYALSAWGELVWNQTRDDIYGREIYPSPSERLCYGPAFLKSVAGLPADRKRILNRRIDQLAAHLENGGRTEASPASLDFKPLQGRPRPPSTHEMDAWADKAAHRLFGHFEGAVFILDCLAEHL
ncbi:putative CRISPR-associated protein [Thermodesulfobacteriota bacterium B35]